MNLTTLIALGLLNCKWVSGFLPFASSGRTVHSKMLASASATDSAKPASERISDVWGSSLAGDFLIDCYSSSDQCVWTLLPLKDISTIDRTVFSSEGGQAWAALHDTDTERQTPAFKLVGSLSDRTCTVVCESASGLDSTLVAVLSRVLAQWTIGQKLASDDNETWTFVLPNEQTSTKTTSKDTASLFATIPGASGSEIVEMVDRSGRTLGSVPRKLVHTLNLLHRGIGMFVTKDSPMMLESGQPQPDLYVHRRTDTKRIFPSMYDMFVGGVSGAGEDAIVTAEREVAEELGLLRGKEQLSGPLLKCVVCTGYNRCVVDLFVYVCKTSEESIKWQEEEVAWGSFVPYSIIEAAADRSILRLANVDEWPGQKPPVQSLRKGDADEKVMYEGATPWPAWDFVPDGLLVWEAWLRELDIRAG